MKSVLISVQPKWCELIASGKKTVEVRKTKPKMETPFKVYIYMTAGDAVYPVTINGAPYTCSNVGGKCVIGEFVCRQVDKLNERDCFEGMDEINNSFLEENSCVDIDSILKYKGDNEYIYAWHISDLVIYDKPKELSEFYVWKKCNSCRDTGYESTACCYDEDCRVPAIISRPPQSWCYVEERSRDERI